MTARKLVIPLTLLLAVMSTGCSLLPHQLQPTQLRKLNRGPALGRDTSNFSIPAQRVKSQQLDPMLHGDPFRTDSHQVLE